MAFFRWLTLLEWRLFITLFLLFDDPSSVVPPKGAPIVVVCCLARARVFECTVDSIKRCIRLLMLFSFWLLWATGFLLRMALSSVACRECFWNILIVGLLNELFVIMVFRGKPAQYSPSSVSSGGIDSYVYRSTLSFFSTMLVLVKFVSYFVTIVFTGICPSVSTESIVARL